MSKEIRIYIGIEGMNKYEQGKIYQIVDVGFNKCYIGSTCEGLKRRMARHREHYKAHVNGCTRKHERSMMLFDEFGIDNCKILLIKDFPCSSRAELEREEGREILNNIDKCVNKNVVGRTPREYYYDNQERLLQNKKEHRLNNIEQYKEKDRKYNDNNKEKISERRKKQYEQNKEQHAQRCKAYRDKNHDKLKTMWNNYYEKNKEVIRQKSNIKVACKCGGAFTVGNKAQHFKTQKHQNWLEQQEPEQEAEPTEK